MNTFQVRLLMLKLTFHQTKAEVMVRIASTLIFNALSRTGHPLVKLAALAEKPQYGFTARASFEEVGPKFVRITDLQDGGINWNDVPYCKCDQPEKYLLSPGDILFARTGATTGKTYLARQPPHAVFASYLIRLRPNNHVHAEYLYAFFQSDTYWSQILAEKKGSAQPNVNGKKLMNIRLPIADSEIQTAIGEFLTIVRARQDGKNEELPELPLPLSEQHRIVARIEALAAKVETAQGLRQQTAKELEALSITSEQTTFHNLAEKFPCDSLGNLITMSSGEGLNKDQFDESYEFAVYGGGGYISRYHKFLFEEPKIAIGRVGARCGCVFVTEPKSWITDNALCVIAHSDQLETDYLSFALRSLDLRQNANQAAQPVISQRKISPLEIPIPSKKEQRRIVTYLDDLQAKVDSLKDLQAETTAELDALLPSILDKAFKGKL